MPRLFISYSRVDRPFVRKLVPLVRDMWEYENVWFDGNLHGGQEWWEEILQQISACDIFIYLLSNEAIASEYCQAEYKEATRLQKQILPVQIRAKANIPEDLKRKHFVDMSDGIQTQSLNQFHTAVRKLSARITPTPSHPLNSQPVPIPSVVDPIVPNTRNRLVAKVIVAVIVLFVAVGVFALGVDAFVKQVNGGSFFISRTNQASLTEQNSTTTPETAVALAPTDEPTTTHTVEIVSSDTFTPSPTPESPTFTPSPTATDTEAFANTSVPPTSMTVDAIFSYNPIVGAPLTLGFVNQSTGSISSHVWYFGDGTVSNDINPVHTYAAGGDYTVTLTVTSAVDGSTDSTIVTASVIAPTRTSTGALTTTPLAEVVVNVASANLRSGPGTNYSVVAVGREGTAFPIVARTADNEWYLVQRETGGNAWIWSDIVTSEYPLDTVPVAEEVPTPAGGVSYDPSCGYLSQTDFPMHRDVQISFEIYVLANKSLILNTLSVATSLQVFSPNNSLILSDTIPEGSGGARVRRSYRINTEESGTYTIIFLPSDDTYDASSDYRTGILAFCSTT